MKVISGDECYTNLDNNGYILYYFTASWCGPCQRIWDDLLKLTENHPNIVFFKIDISDEDNSELCEKCSVDSVPSFLIFKDRSFIDKVVGADLKNVETMLNKYKDN